MNNIEICERPNYKYTVNINNRYIKVKGVDRLHKVAISAFMRVISYFITVETDLSYSMNAPSSDKALSFPINILSNEDKSTTAKEMIMKKIKIIKNYLENEADYSQLMRSMKISLSYMLKYKFDFSRMLYLSATSLKNQIDINLKPPTCIVPATFISHKYGDDEIYEICNPYINQAMIVIDKSVPYEEMGFDYNSLHLYEHLLCAPWLKLDQSDEKDSVISVNGLTCNVGLCFVYAILANRDTFEKYLSAELNWVYKFRNRDAWDSDDITKALRKETNRTISETLQAPIPWMFARSPGHAFDFGYNKDIFHYWSNKPLNITIIHPFKEFNIDTFMKNINVVKEVAVKKPEIPKVKYYPYSALVSCSNVPMFVTEKMDPKDIANALVDYAKNGKIIDGMFGLDVRRRNINDKDKYENFSCIRLLPITFITTYRRYMKASDYERIVANILIRLNENDFELLFDEMADTPFAFDSGDMLLDVPRMNFFNDE